MDETPLRTCITTIRDADRVGAAAATAAAAATTAASLHKKRNNNNNNTMMANEKRSQLVLAHEAPRFGPCVIDSDVIWNEICICHQSAQYHLAEYSRLYKSIHMAPNLIPAEDDIDLVCVEDLTSNPDAWRLKVERDFAMRDLRVVRDRLELLAGPRPRLSRGAVGVSAISAVGLVASNQITTLPSFFSSGFLVSFFMSLFYQVTPWLRRALATYCISSVSNMLDRVRDFAYPEFETQWLSTRWLEMLRWFPDGIY